ncbi:type I addiction module toxin, SymE family [Flavobacterium circumlabens]|uniref:Type I addiction module toxin, SymE family n=1 Tax=Flavobacterium circumlabens TaxID=2133765 RepID=A0A4Y7UCN2_9FLAO|nr:SymE family type I addiction module toxin [Flavobacterium circumlabens]TCN58792.1 type I toxin-antitoxin system toxin SymE [Flavobacterium circumlabens]TEB44207.1 type I addiction module toxin, SymE family [Flavobacterium circumlabens]
MIHSRKLKIHTIYKARNHKITTTPVIRLAGKWLKELGFIEGQMVNIKQQKNKLTITMEKKHK